MAITQVTAYRATDGSLHDTREAAVRADLAVLLEATPSSLDKIMAAAPAILEALAEASKIVVSTKK